MATQHGDIGLLKDPVAQSLLKSTNMAQLAYVWRDGTPRVVPIWFHWDGSELVLGTPPKAPKLQALQNDAPVAVTINSTDWPYKVLSIRGTASVTWVNGVVKEYAQAAERYFGEQGGKDWVNQMGSMSDKMARVAIKPNWVSVLDFESRFPTAVEKLMEGAG